MVVPFGAGGAADRAARAFAAAFARDGDEVAIEDVPGEGGRAGVLRANALASESNEAVLLLGTPTTHILLPAWLGPSAAPDRALEPVAGLGSAPNVLLVSTRLGVSRVEELVALARTGRLVYASAGAGQTIHACTAYFCALAGIRMAHRPYDAGSAHAYADLAAGRVHVYFDNVLACREAIARGDVVPLAVSAKERTPLLPAVPVLAECGFPEHALDIWFGVFGARLSEAQSHRLESARRDADLRRVLGELGLTGAMCGGPALVEEMERSEGAWQRAVRSVGRVR